MENCDEKAKVLASKYLFKNPWLTVRQEKTELPNDSKQHLDGGECLTVHLLTLDEIKQLLKENGIIQSLHACALWKYIAENHLL